MPKMGIYNTQLSGDAKQSTRNQSADMEINQLRARHAMQSMKYDGVDLRRLASELERLSAAILKRHPDAVAEAKLVELAQVHAESGDGKSAKEILGRLGKWVSKVALEAGTTIAAKFIEDSVGG